MPVFVPATRFVFHGSREKGRGESLYRRHRRVGVGVKSDGRFCLRVSLVFI